MLPDNNHAFFKVPVKGSKPNGKQILYQSTVWAKAVQSALGRQPSLHCAHLTKLKFVLHP